MAIPYIPTKVDAPIVIPGQNCWVVERHYITAQPTNPTGLQAANSLGVKSVVCLRDATEGVVKDYLPFDPKEDSELITLGIAFVNIPFPHSMPQDQFDIRAKAVLDVLKELPRPTLMHCSSGDRASALWATRLIVHCGLSNADAIKYAKMSGLEVFIPYVEKFKA